MAPKKTHKNPSKDVSKNREDQPPKHTSLSIKLGSQYLCHSTFNAPNVPQIFTELKAPPHLHLIVDVSMQQFSDAKATYEVRLIVQALGLDHAPQKDEELKPIYHAHIVYAGIFSVEGTGKKEDVEQFVLHEASHFLYPSVRTITLDLIREAGFVVGSIQPIDFKELWKQRKLAKTAS